MTAPAAETTPTKAKGDPILRVSGLKQHFPITSGVLFKKVIGEATDSHLKAVKAALADASAKMSATGG